MMEHHSPSPTDWTKNQLLIFGMFPMSYELHSASTPREFCCNSLSDPFIHLVLDGFMSIQFAFLHAMLIIALDKVCWVTGRSCVDAKKSSRGTITWPLLRNPDWNWNFIICTNYSHEMKWNEMKWVLTGKATYMNAYLNGKSSIN